MIEISNNIADTAAKLMVMGVGGAGCNAVNRMIAEQVKGVDFVAVNTDVQDLSLCQATQQVQIGEKLTEGLGAGGDPEMGKKSAEESIEDIEAQLKDVKMLFVTCGMGGGTGTGAAPVIARTSKEKGILTVGVVTKPFKLEGGARMQRAVAGINELIECVDALIVVPNQKLLAIAENKTSMAAAFNKADEVLQRSVQGITDLITKNGLINLDYADIKNVLGNAGYAHMGYGYAKGDNKIMEAVKMAINSPLLETTIDGAEKLLFNISGSESGINLFEADEASEYIKSLTGEGVDAYFGIVHDENLSDDEVVVTLVATGITKVEDNGSTARPKTSGVTPGMRYDSSTLTAKSSLTSNTAPVKPAPAPAPTRPVAPAPAPVQPAQPTNGIASPSPKSNVAATDIKIPDFLK